MSVQKTGCITSSCTYYIVWCTKYRRKVLNSKEVDEKLRELIIEYANAEVIDIKIMPDHVILLVTNVDPRFGIHRLIHDIKGGTSHALRNDKELPWLKTCLSTLWTRNYFVSSIGDIQFDIIQKYIEEQKYY
ncbi:IS200/IS605 family transposase [Desulfosporosinus sp. SYSU MS00001]|uniref:IS200/IS605 family transposase n=1 Tax=Desulfosporosinus sp. SYSU MS00001 TaxID=3416284 RepID=UPI003CF86DAA